MDVSRAVEAARELTAALPGVSLIRCDLLRLPFPAECFDVIGGFRARYRFLGAEDRMSKLGPPVDPSGALPDGRKFNDICNGACRRHFGPCSR
jgi:hypothetical protein